MKKLKKILPFLIIAATVGLVYSFFNIDGREIKNIKKLSSDCRVSVTINDTYGHNNMQEYELNAEQTEALKMLLMNNSYKRRLSSTIIGQLPEKSYTILADRDKDGMPQMLAYIKIIGNGYINFSQQFNFLSIIYITKLKIPILKKN